MISIVMMVFKKTDKLEIIDGKQELSVTSQLQTENQWLKQRIQSLGVRIKMFDRKLIRMNKV